MKNITLRQLKNASGFTLIELLVVIAVIGVLATVILLAVNPLEQLARGRDSGRKSGVTTLGNGVQAYYTSRNGSYPTADTTWVTQLQNAGEIKVPPPIIALQVTGRTTACTSANVTNYCFATSGTDFIVYTRLESNAENSKCATGNPGAWFTYLSAQGRACLVCTADGATNPSTGSTCNTVQ